MQTFGERLKKRMDDLGLKAPDVARALEIKNRQTVNSWTKGISKPHADDLLRLAQLLETTVDYLLAGDEPKPYQIPASQMLIAREEYVEYMTLKNKALQEQNTQQEAEIERLRKDGETVTKH